MHLFWDLVPCVVAVTAAGVLLSLVLFAAMQRRAGTIAKALAGSEASRQAEASELTNQINELKRRVVELEKADMRVCAEQQPEGELSTAVRSMALKLRRSGQAPDQIAQKLRLSKGEVELLIKAQKIVMRPYEHAETALPEGLKKS